jgi:hypothetical protein
MARGNTVNIWVAFLAGMFAGAPIGLFLTALYLFTQRETD